MAPIKGALDDSGVRGQTIPTSQFLPDLGWLDPQQVAKRIGAITYRRAKTLAGVMTTASNKTLLFAIFVNDVPLPKGVTPIREGKAIGELCEFIQQKAP